MWRSLAAEFAATAFVGMNDVTRNRGRQATSPEDD